MNSRVLTTKDLYGKKFITYPFEGVYEKVLGIPSIGGAWLVYGKSKNGKSWGTLLLCKKLIEMGNKILYISAEEGSDKAFVEAVARAKIPHNSKNITYVEYEPIEALKQRLRKRNTLNIVVLDNLTSYGKELRGNVLLELIREFPNITFICVAHEKRNQPFPASAEMALIFAKVIFQVKGLQMIVSGRVPGGILTIDEEKAALFGEVA